jgi:Flp pilus assembly protein TadD
VSEAFPAAQVSAFKSNKANVQAILLLQKGRVFEAESILKAALQSDPKNPFLLDSMGYALEAEGDLQGALRYYSAAASLQSDERVLLTPRVKWRGRKISDIAAESAKSVSETIAKGEDTDAQVARLNLRGVSALNHNDPASAQKFFREAYKLDPNNAFTLNNIGYISELNGDRESAQMYYEAAGSAAATSERVTYATRRDAEGRRVGSLAAGNQDDVESALSAIQSMKRRRTRQPIELKRRDESIVTEPAPKQQAPLSVQPPPLPPLPLPNANQAPSGVQPLAPRAPSSPPNEDRPPQ